MNIWDAIKTRIFNVDRVRSVLWSEFHSANIRSWGNPEQSFPECSGRWWILDYMKDSLPDDEFVELYNLLLHHRNLNWYVVNEARAELTKELAEDVEEITKRYLNSTVECDEHRAQILKNGGTNNA